MDWLTFILNNDAAIGAIIGLSILFGIGSFMMYYVISHIRNASPEE